MGVKWYELIIFIPYQLYNLTHSFCHREIRVRQFMGLSPVEWLLNMFADSWSSALPAKPLCASGHMSRHGEGWTRNFPFNFTFASLLL